MKPAPKGSGISYPAARALSPQIGRPKWPLSSAPIMLNRKIEDESAGVNSCNGFVACVRSGAKAPIERSMLAKNSCCHPSITSCCAQTGAHTAVAAHSTAAALKEAGNLKG